MNTITNKKTDYCSTCVYFIPAPCFLMCIRFYVSFIWLHVYAFAIYPGVPSSQALLGFLITAPPPVLVPAVLGALPVWIQNQKKNSRDVDRPAVDHGRRPFHDHRLSAESQEDTWRRDRSAERNDIMFCVSSVGQWKLPKKGRYRTFVWWHWRKFFDILTWLWASHKRSLTVLEQQRRCCRMNKDCFYFCS